MCMQIVKFPALLEVSFEFDTGDWDQFIYDSIVYKIFTRRWLTNSARLGSNLRIFKYSSEANFGIFSLLHRSTHMVDLLARNIKLYLIPGKYPGH